LSINGNTGLDTSGIFYIDNIRVVVSDQIPDPVPQSATMFLLGIGLVGVAGAARRRKKINQA